MFVCLFVCLLFIVYCLLTGSPRPIDFFTSLDLVRDVSCGDGHTLALTESGRIFHCGVKLGVSGENDYPDLLDFHPVSPGRVASSAFKQVALNLVVFSGIKQVECLYMQESDPFKL